MEELETPQYGLEQIPTPSMEQLTFKQKVAMVMFGLFLIGLVGAMFYYVNSEARDAVYYDSLIKAAKECMNQYQTDREAAFICERPLHSFLYANWTKPSVLVEYPFGA